MATVSTATGIRSFPTRLRVDWVDIEARYSYGLQTAVYRSYAIKEKQRKQDRLLMSSCHAIKKDRSQVENCLLTPKYTVHYNSNYIFLKKSKIS